MTQYSEDGKWWWDGESWIPTTPQSQPNAPVNNTPVAKNISEKVSSFSSKFGASNNLSKTVPSPRIVVSGSTKKKLTLNLLTPNGNRNIEFSQTTLGAGYNMIIDDNKPTLVTGKFGGLSKNTKGNGLTGFKTTTKHYFGVDLQSCELVFHYKSGMTSSNIKKIEISSSTGFYFSHEI
jgi:hypothetical protein|tara:strand:- start:78 stop:611 length:534 start_codon:yes stop_codon:yes gene_type:complete